MSDREIVEGMGRVMMSNLAQTHGIVGAIDVQDVLCLVLEEFPSVEEISSWTQEQRDEAYKWAAYCHLEASDNNVPVVKKPIFLEGYR